MYKMLTRLSPSIEGSRMLVLSVLLLLQLLFQSSEAAPATATVVGAHHNRDASFFPHHNVKHHSEPRNIYIDLGTNDGSSIISFTKQLSSDGLAGDGSATLEGGWKDLVARPDKATIPLSKWHILAFEAYHGHNSALATIEKNLTDTKAVASIKIFNGTAISVHDGTIKFIYDGYDKAGHAATTMKESAAANGDVVTVPCMDIVTLFRKERITIDDFVVLKVDVEGAEYDLVRKIIVTGLYRYIDKLAVEWHHDNPFVFGEPSQDDAKYKERHENHLRYTTQYNSIKWFMEGIEHGPKMFNWGR